MYIYKARTQNGKTIAERVQVVDTEAQHRAQAQAVREQAEAERQAQAAANVIADYSNVYAQHRAGNATEQDMHNARQALARLIAYSTLSKCADPQRKTGEKNAPKGTGNRQAMLALKSDLARADNAVQNNAEAQEKAYILRENKNGLLVSKIKSKAAAAMIDKFAHMDMGSGIDIMQEAYVNILESEQAAEADGRAAHKNWIQTDRAVRELRQTVFYKDADSITADDYRTEDRTPISDCFRACNRMIQATGSVAEANFKYTYLEELATDPQTGEKEYMYRRLPLYSDVGGTACTYGQAGGLYTASKAAVDSVPRMIAYLELTGKQAEAVRLAMRGKGCNQIAAAMGLSAGNVYNTMQGAQRKAIEKLPFYAMRSIALGAQNMAQAAQIAAQTARAAERAAQTAQAAEAQANSRCTRAQAAEAQAAARAAEKTAAAAVKRAAQTAAESMRYNEKAAGQTAQAAAAAAEKAAGYATRHGIPQAQAAQTAQAAAAAAVKAIRQAQNRTAGRAVESVSMANNCMHVVTYCNAYTGRIETAERQTAQAAANEFIYLWNAGQTAQAAAVVYRRQTEAQTAADMAADHRAAAVLHTETEAQADGRAAAAMLIHDREQTAQAAAVLACSVIDNTTAEAQAAAQAAAQAYSRAAAAQAAAEAQAAAQAAEAQNVAQAAAEAQAAAARAAAEAQRLSNYVSNFTDIRKVRKENRAAAQAARGAIKAAAAQAAAQAAEAQNVAQAAARAATETIEK